MFDEISNESLVKYLIYTERLFSKNVIDAFYIIDRADFVREESKADAYFDMPLGIGFSQTISQPQVVAFMLELLDAKRRDNVLDIGAGSGYTTALLSKIVGKNGFVTGLDRVSELVKFGQNNLKKYDISNACIKQADNKLGVKGKKFDRILVSAAANDLPHELIEQLKVGGRLVIPIGSSIYLIEKREDSLVHEEFRGFSFVPLIY